MSITIHLSRTWLNSPSVLLVLFWAGSFTFAASYLSLVASPQHPASALWIAFSVTGLLASALVLPLGLKQMAAEKKHNARSPRNPRKNRSLRAPTRYTPRRPRATLDGHPARGALTHGHRKWAA